MDVLDDILDTLNLKGALYFRTDFSGPWGVTVPNLPGAARFHLVVCGSCSVTIEDLETVNLGPGDLILIPAGRRHILADKPGRTAPPLETVLDDAGYRGEGVLSLGDGDAGASTQMICGHFTFREGADHPILRSLPSHIIATAADRARSPWLDESLRLATQRMFSPELGAAASVTRLSEIVFIELIRSSASHNPETTAMITAIRDRQIGITLQLMHTQPDANWTVEGLAHEAGMSRSRYAEKFRALIGMGPMAYLSEWRLQKALSLLDQSRSSVQQIAQATGYRSPAAFTRAFAGKFGLPPSEYRRSLN